MLSNKNYFKRRAGFCYVAFNSPMFNATYVQLHKWYFHIKFGLFIKPIHVWRSRTPAGVRCAHSPSVYHNNNGSECTVVKTVELT
jgi:hypothetical protein